MRLDSANRAKIAESTLFGRLESCGLERDSSFWLSSKRSKNFNMDFLFDFSIDSCFARIYNRRGGGVALHGVLPLATEIRLKSIDKQGVKRPDESHIKDTNCQAESSVDSATLKGNLC